MRSIVITYKIQAGRNEIYPYILEMEKFGSLHPLMIKVTQMGNNKYQIEERVKLFGFIPMKPVYVAEVSEQNNGIVYISEVKKGTDLKITFHFSENGDGETSVTETVEISGNPLAAAILINTIKKSHAEVFKSIDLAARKINREFI
jgi:hypothetical protein